MRSRSNTPSAPSSRERFSAAIAVSSWRSATNGQSAATPTIKQRARPGRRTIAHRRFALPAGGSAVSTMVIFGKLTCGPIDLPGAPESGAPPPSRGSAARASCPRARSGPRDARSSSRSPSPASCSLPSTKMTAPAGSPDQHDACRPPSRARRHALAASPAFRVKRCEVGAWPDSSTRTSISPAARPVSVAGVSARSARRARRSPRPLGLLSILIDACAADGAVSATFVGRGLRSEHGTRARPSVAAMTSAAMAPMALRDRPSSGSESCASGELLHEVARGPRSAAS